MKRLSGNLGAALKRFARNNSGSVATMFALSSIPIFAAAGAVIDYNRVLEAEVELQALADAGALAGASNTGNEAAQEAAATAFINKNALELPGLSYTFTVEADDEEVEVKINADLKGTLIAVALAAAGNSAGDGSVVREIKAAAKFEQQDPEDVCLLTTATSAPNAMQFRGNADVEATACGFHSDSSSISGLYRNGSSTVDADFFHVVGGLTEHGGGGHFTETPVTGKDDIGDPFDFSNGCPTSGGSSVTPSNGASLNAATYVNITVGNRVTATFTPGTHYIRGTITVRNGGALVGNGVTLVMCGASASFNHQGGDIRLQAPTSGTYAGFAVVGDDTATSTSTLRGGNNTYFRGIYYTPNAKLDISGNSEFNVDSKYFPVVTNQFELGGTGDFNIEMNNDFYGYPERPELRTSDSRTVYLVR
jgi:Flp pilus assembly protein TadG